MCYKLQSSAETNSPYIISTTARDPVQAHRQSDAPLPTAVSNMSAAQCKRGKVDVNL